VVPPIFRQTEVDLALFALVERAIAHDMPAAFEQLAFSQALETWMNAVFACNAYIDAQAPWSLKKTDFERMRTVLATLYIVIAELAVAVAPVMPCAMDKLLGVMGVPDDLRTFDGIQTTWYSPLAESHYTLAQPVGLFPRLESSESEAA
jgi:methionyl-tRNA synthetase